ncbi:MAG: hypothetical protein RIS35_2523 [Pseudomonadota bacterium]|jgi:acyl-coenzyme A synthetase/AMP-(fatty) acid ligase
MIDGYLGDPEATARQFRGGWFYPMDLGRLEPDGQLVFCGRADDMMIVNGINLYPAEVERCLMSHPAVRDCVAFPVPHPVHQDVPVCAVVVDPMIHTTAGELRDHVCRRIGAYALGSVLILDRIPRNAQGKPVRAELLALHRQAARSPEPPAA